VLRSVPMVHFQVQLPKGDAAAATRCIASEGLLHLVDVAHGGVPGDAAPEGTRELLAAYQDLAHRTRRLLERLGVSARPVAGRLDDAQVTDFARERVRLEGRLAPIERRFESLWRSWSESRDGLAHARDATDRATRLRRAHVDIGRLVRLRFTRVRLGLIDSAEASSLAVMLSPAPFAIVPLESEDGSCLTAVSVPASAGARLDSALRAVAFEPVELPDDPATWEPTALERDQARAEAEYGRLGAAMEDFTRDSGSALQEVAARADVGVLLLQAQLHFAAAGRFVVISGWVPHDEADRLRLAIESATGRRALVDVHQPDALPAVATGALRVPILYRNPMLLRPFQRLVHLYGTPSYEEVEPTAFFALSFLLMFGLMFGDVGHGLVLFSAGYYLYRYLPHFLDYGILLMEGGTLSTCFGVLYGSVFGIEGLIPVLWLSPIHDLPRFMTIAVSIGIVLMTLGLGLNAVNMWRAGQRAKALVGSKGMLGAFLYWVLLVLLARAFVPEQLTVPGWLISALVVGAASLLVLRVPIVRWLEPSGPPRHRVIARPVWLALLEGSVELVDTLFGYFANTISFVRIAAFAAVHAGVFIALFALADTLAGLRFGDALAIASLVAGNILVILLEGLTVSVQVLRLEYYEFFGKFFIGGGEPYRPLMLDTPKDRERHDAQ